MIKHDHENESSQTISTKNKSESHFLNHISHFETRCKTCYQHILAAIRFNIYYNKQNLIKKSSLTRIHRNNDLFTEFHQIVQKKKITANQKLIIVMFSKKRIHKHNVYLHLLSFAFSKIRARFNLFVKSDYEIDSF